MELLLPASVNLHTAVPVPFTFQYGATATNINEGFTSDTPQFTFQYGATATVWQNRVNKRRSLIYIPIWSYCYLRFNVKACLISLFTFQYGATAT